MNNTLYIVVPCYNEQEVLPETSKRLKAKLEQLITAGKISEKSRVLFVNDGSKDRTWEIISALHQQSPLFCGVDLTRNRGHQNALLAGLMTAKDKADAVISMDAARLPSLSQASRRLATSNLGMSSLSRLASFSSLGSCFSSVPMSARISSVMMVSASPAGSTNSPVRPTSRITLGSLK